MRVIVLAVLSLALSGCASLLPGPPPTLNPVRIDPTADAADYQRAIAKMREFAAAQPVTIESYVLEGIALTGANCRVWLRSIDDAQRRFDATRQNGNVLASLGVAVMGLVGATPALVGSYGAAMTAANGFADNYDAGLAIGPTSQNVAARIMELRESYAKQLRADASSLTFPEARNRLNALDDLCSRSTANALVNGSLANTTATVTATGTVTTTATPAAAAAISSSFVRDDSGTRIVAYWMPAGTVDAAHDAALKAWMTANGVNVSVPFLAHSKLYEAARAKAVGDLGIP